MFIGDPNDTFNISHPHGTLFCTDDYSSSCDIDGEEWQCDESSICDMDYIMETMPTTTSLHVQSKMYVGDRIYVVVIAATLIATVCYLKYLLQRKPKLELTAVHTATIATSDYKKPTVEHLERYFGVIVHDPTPSNTYSCGSDHTMTATPSEQYIDHHYPPIEEKQ